MSIRIAEPPPHEVSVKALLFVRERLEACIRMIDLSGLDTIKPSEIGPLAWILGEELVGLLPRLWRAGR